jgi:hypothetical protein
MFAWIATHAVAYPLLEVVHILGISLLLGNLFALECRVFGAGRELSLPALGRLSLMIALSGFSIAAASGLLMFASQAQDLLANRAFTLKMGLLMLAGCNAAFFHARGGLARIDGFGKAQTALSLGLWICIIICGRWIAYR